MIGDTSANLSWAERFCRMPGCEFFCVVDPLFIQNKYNLAGLSDMMEHYTEAYKTITDCDMDSESLDDSFDFQSPAAILYGLIHARYIHTEGGMEKMALKFSSGDFGYCPRYKCGKQAVLPVGIITTEPNEPMVKLYCPKCVDIYTPESIKHQQIDGFYFGESFPHLLLQKYPNLLPEPTI